MSRARSIFRWLLALMFLGVGYVHFAQPETFLDIMPAWVPWPGLVVTLTGIAESAGAIGLVQWRSAGLRRAAGWGLALYSLCVWPANINHMLIDMASPDGGLGMAYHVPRMFMQPVIIWLALWSSEAIDWPFRRASSSP